MKGSLSILLLTLLGTGLSAKGLMLSEVVQLKNQFKDTINLQKNKLKERKLSATNKRQIDNGISKKGKPVSRADRYLKPVKARYLEDAVQPQAKISDKKSQNVKPSALQAVKPPVLQSKPSTIEKPKLAKIATQAATRDLTQKRKAFAFASKSHRIATHKRTTVAKKVAVTRNNALSKRFAGFSHPGKSVLLQHAAKNIGAKKLMNVLKQARANKQLVAKKYAKRQALKRKRVVRKAVRGKKLSKKTQLAQLKNKIRAAMIKQKGLKGKKLVTKKHFVVRKHAVVKHHAIRRRSRHLNSGLNQNDDKLLAALSQKVQSLKEKSTQDDNKANTAPTEKIQPVVIQNSPVSTPKPASPQRKLKNTFNKERTLLDLPSQNEFYSQMVDQYSDKF